MKIIVTGGAGFIGSHVVEALVREGHEVSVLDDFNDYYDNAWKRANIASVSNSIRLYEGDIRDRDFIAKTFEEGKFEGVFHFAARAGVRPSIVRPELYLSTNIMGTFHILEAAQKNGVQKFVLASSSSVYGVNKKIPFSEDDCIAQTISPYAATKLASEQLCSNYAHLYGISTVCLRFFTVYGPRQRPDLAIYKFTDRIAKGEPIERYGDGSTGRDYTYVDDIVQGVMGALHYEEKPFDIFNLGECEVTKLKDLIGHIEKALGKEAIIVEMPEQPGDVPLTCADISKAREHLGYNPQTPLSVGIPRFVEWYRETADSSAVNTL